MQDWERRYWEAVKASQDCVRVDYRAGWEGVNSAIDTLTNSFIDMIQDPMIAFVLKCTKLKFMVIDHDGHLPEYEGYSKEELEEMAEKAMSTAMKTIRDAIETADFVPDGEEIAGQQIAQQ